MMMAADSMQNTLFERYRTNIRKSVALCIVTCYNLNRTNVLYGGWETVDRFQVIMEVVTRSIAEYKSNVFAMLMEIPEYTVRILSYTSEGG